jgi:hypothetical protein
MMAAVRRVGEDREAQENVLFAAHRQGIIQMRSRPCRSRGEMLDADHIAYEVTVEDPKVFTRPSRYDDFLARWNRTSALLFGSPVVRINKSPSILNNWI